MSTYIGIEMGGTKVVLARGSGPEDLSAAEYVPTTTPEATVSAMLEAMHRLVTDGAALAGIGIASFGPIGVTPNAPAYGRFLNTPKPGYSHFDLLGPLQAAFPGVPFAIDTDVNGAAVGEGRWGAAQGLDNFAYITVGTGIGVGLVSNGRPVHGLLHPEGGHILIRRDRSVDGFAGCCPFHGDCLEGLASGKAIGQRLGRPAETLASDDPMWDLVGSYIAQLCYNLTLITSPQRIVLGGGVGSLPQVLAAVREHLSALMGDYIAALSDRAAYETYICAPGLGNRAGVLGAIALTTLVSSRG